MSFVRLADIDQRQHHEYECLQQHDKNVEDRPDRTGDDMSQKRKDAGGVESCPGPAQKRNQEENQFACIHVSKQPHAK